MAVQGEISPVLQSVNENMFAFLKSGEPHQGDELKILSFGDLSKKRPTLMLETWSGFQ